MTENNDAAPVPPHRRVRPAAVMLLLATATLASLVVSVSYGLALEYGDTTATAAQATARSFRDWGLGILLVTGLSAWAIAAARGSRGRRAISVTAALAAALTLVGVPAGAVVGAQQKFARYPDLPSCTDGFRTGPAVPVVRAAQAGFSELDHPGPFSGGGSSGIDGCSSQLMVHDHVDVPAAYRSTLVGNGWRISHDGQRLVAATKKGQDFEAARDRGGSWWVWIGPAGLEAQPTRPGEVAPRR